MVDSEHQLDVHGLSFVCPSHPALLSPPELEDGEHVSQAHSTSVTSATHGCNAIMQQTCVFVYSVGGCNEM